MGQQMLHQSAVVQLQWVELVYAWVHVQLSCMECWSSLWVQRAVGLLREQQVQVVGTAGGECAGGAPGHSGIAGAMLPGGVSSFFTASGCRSRMWSWARL